MSAARTPARRTAVTACAIAAFAACVPALTGTATAAPGDLSVTRIADINPGPPSSTPDRFTDVNGTLFFDATDPTNGNELWRSSPPYTTATMVEDALPGGGINPGAADSAPQDLTNVNGTLFFVAEDDTNGTELWKSAPPYTTATMVEDAVPGGGIAPGAASSLPIELTGVNGILFFQADDGTEQDAELWKSDGTTATRVEDAVPGGGINPVDSSSPQSLTNVDGTLFFTATDGTNGIELWTSDGAIATMVEDAVPGGGIGPGAADSAPQVLTAVGDTLFFRAQEPTNGSELWKSAPPYTTATLVEDAVPLGGINPGAGHSIPDRLTDVGGTLFFRATGGINGIELWKIAPPYTTAAIVEDGVPGGGINPTGDSTPETLTDIDGTLAFTATDGANGIELWTSDGTTATMVEDGVPGGGINPGAGDSLPTRPTDVDGILLFRADDGTNGGELWQSAPPYTTATMVEDAVPGGGINPGAASSNPGDGAVVNGTLLFPAEDGTNGFELWRSDGTVATMLEDAVPGGGINPGAASSFPGEPTAVNGTVFIRANDGTTGVELWRTAVESAAPPVNPVAPTSPKKQGKKKCKKAKKKGKAAAAKKKKKCKKKRK